MARMDEEQKPRKRRRTKSKKEIERKWVLAAPPSLRASVRYCAQLGEGRFRIGMKFTAVSIEAAELLVEALAL